MKPLGKGNYIVRPYPLFKNHLYVCTFPSGSDSEERINIDEAIQPPDTWLWSGSDEPVNNDGIYKRTLHSGIRSLFYPTGSESQSMFTTQLSTIYSPSSQFYVVNVSQQAFGNEIRPGSFIVTTENSTGSVVDDTIGRLYLSPNTSSVVGNIFYSHGIAVINKNISGSEMSNLGLNLADGTDVTVRFDSSILIHEHIAICNLEVGELNYSTNPSLWRLTTSSSISGSGKLLDYFASGTLNPYMTTIGLYDSLGQLVAIGKVPKPVKRTQQIAQSFIIKFDI